MTVRRTIQITCDELSDFVPGEPCHMFYGADKATVAATRKAARQAGWRYRPGHPTEGSGRDICPRHPSPSPAPQRPERTED